MPDVLDDYLKQAPAQTTGGDVLDDYLSKQVPKASKPGAVSRFVTGTGLPATARALTQDIPTSNDPSKGWFEQELEGDKQLLKNVWGIVKGIGGASKEHLDAAQEFAKKGDYTSALAHAISATPVLGPMAYQISTDLSDGNISGALGGLATALAPIHGSKVATAVKTTLEKTVPGISKLANPGVLKEAAGVASPRAAHAINLWNKLTDVEDTKATPAKSSLWTPGSGALSAEEKAAVSARPRSSGIDLTPEGQAPAPTADTMGRSVEPLSGSPMGPSAPTQPPTPVTAAETRAAARGFKNQPKKGAKAPSPDSYTAIPSEIEFPSVGKGPRATPASDIPPGPGPASPSWSPAPGPPPPLPSKPGVVPSWRPVSGTPPTGPASPPLASATPATPIPEPTVPVTAPEAAARANVADKWAQALHGNGKAFGHEEVSGWNDAQWKKLSETIGGKKGYVPSERTRTQIVNKMKELQSQPKATPLSEIPE